MTDARDIYDVTIIGGGPVGLFAAFYAGMRGLRTKILDILEELGGQLIAVYPEKYIYDVAGFPKILAKDYVKGAVEQGLATGAVPCLGEEVRALERVEDDGLFRLTTSKDVHWTRTVLICAGVGGFEPKRLSAPGVTEFEGRGVHYFVRGLDQFRDKDVVIVGGGDSAVDWALTLEPLARQVSVVHRSKFRAHEKSVRDLEESSVRLHYPFYEVAELRGNDGLEQVLVHQTRSGERSLLPAQELIIAIGFSGKLGPLAEWGLTLERNSIVVDPLTMATGVPGVFGAGDVVTYPAKFKLIATGAAEAVTAVNHAMLYINPKARLDPGHSTNIMEKKGRTGGGADTEE
ncbi:MAG TPA: NAD(P)/FAD-dependent oxidoreductase [Thermomicrobiaceae bacterium]|nr:NAD(P)/FAD-dependent oxidoreductase [Thermomicrobiaceae bacterium]